MKMHKLITYLKERTKSLTNEEQERAQCQFDDMMQRHKEWIQTPEGILEVLANPNVVDHMHLSPTFLWRDSELTHEEKMKIYKDYKDYHKGKRK